LLARLLALLATKCLLHLCAHTIFRFLFLCSTTNNSKHQQQLLKSISEESEKEKDEEAKDIKLTTLLIQQ